uniref:Uncharacterized protein n=1 Tax=Heterorhabditis bacteriophora TaxID=37862 RepID=A0A1I7WGX4_HETBA
MEISSIFEVLFWVKLLIIIGTKLILSDDGVLVHHSATVPANRMNCLTSESVRMPDPDVTLDPVSLTLSQAVILTTEDKLNYSFSMSIRIRSFVLDNNSSSWLSYIYQLNKIRINLDKLVRHKLNESQKNCRYKICSVLLLRNKNDPFLDRIVTQIERTGLRDFTLPSLFTRSLSDRLALFKHLDNFLQEKVHISSDNKSYGWSAVHFFFSFFGTICIKATSNLFLFVRIF